MSETPAVKLHSETTDVWRVGGTVRRPAHAGSVAVRALLEYLHAQGFACAPQHLGVDEDGREIFSWIDGLRAPQAHDGR